MRFFRPFLVLALLVPSLQALAAGENQCAKRGLANQLGIAVEDIQLSEASNSPVYVSFPNALAAGDTVTFEILADGEVTLSQVVELTEIAESGEMALSSSAPVVEILAGNAARMSYVHRLSERQHVEVRSLLNGAEQGTQAFADLVAQSELVSIDDVSPWAHRSRVETAAPAALPAAKDAFCIFQCGLDQNTCYDVDCGGSGSSSCYDNCDSIFDECVNDCNGTCTPFTTSNTTFTTVSVTPQNRYECYTSQIFPKAIFRLHTKRIKRTITTTTINTDCSETVTTQISYFNTPCWVYQYSSPFCNSLGFITNLC